MKAIAGMGALAITGGALYWHGDLSGGELYNVPQAELYRQIEDLHPHEKLAAYQIQVPDAKIDVVDEPAWPGIRWHFTHAEDDIGNVVARLSPASGGRTRVNVSFEPGTTDESKWRIKDLRKALRIIGTATMAEQIKAKVEKREVDQSVIANAFVGATMSNLGAIQREALSRADEAAAASREMDEEEARRKQDEAYRKAQENAGKPAVDLSRYR